MIGIGRLVRRFVRKITKPIPGDKAVLWKNRLAITYAVIAWNAFGFVVYFMMTDRADWPLFYGLKTDEEAQVRPGVYYANLLGIKKTTIIRMDGLKKVDELEYDADNYIPSGKKSAENTSTNNTNSEL